MLSWLFRKKKRRLTDKDVVFTLYRYRHAVQYFSESLRVQSSRNFLDEATRDCLLLMLGREPTPEEIDAANDDTQIPF